MEIKKATVCGTLESGDVQVSVLPNAGNGIEIDLESVVKSIFGDAIETTVREVLKELEVNDAKLYLVDQGALDCVIRSRVQIALLRAGEESYHWEKGDAICQEH